MSAATSPDASRNGGAGLNRTSKEAEELNAITEHTDVDGEQDTDVKKENDAETKSKIAEFWGKLGLDIPTAMLMMK